MNNTRDLTISRGPQELECLTDDVAADGADGVGGTPSNAAPHPAGETGEAGGWTQRWL